MLLISSLCGCLLVFSLGLCASIKWLLFMRYKIWICIGRIEIHTNNLTENRRNIINNNNRANSEWMRLQSSWWERFNWIGNPGSEIIVGIEGGNECIIMNMKLAENHQSSASIQGPGGSWGLGLTLTHQRNCFCLLYSELLKEDPALIQLLCFSLLSHHIALCAVKQPIHPRREWMGDAV